MRPERPQLTVSLSRERGTLAARRSAAFVDGTLRSACGEHSRANALAYLRARQDDQRGAGNMPGEHSGVYPVAPSSLTRVLQVFSGWAVLGSNQRPPACKAGALTS